MGQAARGRDRHLAGRGFRGLPRRRRCAGMPPDDAEFCRKHAGRRLIELDPDWARRIERQVDALAELVAREGVTVHRPRAPARATSAPSSRLTARAPQLFPRDAHDRDRRARDRRLAAPDMPPARALRPAAAHPAHGRQRAARAGRACRWARRPASTGRSSRAATRCSTATRSMSACPAAPPTSPGIDWLQALLGDELPRDPGGDEVERPASRLRAGAGQARACWSGARRS